MLTLGDRRVEEPVLNRRQAGSTVKLALLGLNQLASGRHGGQGLHGLVLEQITRAEMNTQLTRTADHLNRQDRVAAQLEEVIVEADFFHVQHRTPDCRQLLLQLTGGRYVVLTIELRVWCRQGTAVKFAVGGQRHAVEQDQVGRHHIVRQLRLEVRFERFTQLRLLLVALPGHIADQIACQLLA